MKALIIAVGFLIIASVCYAAGPTIPKQYVSRFAEPRVVNETFQEQQDRQNYQREVIEILRDMRYNQEMDALGMSLKYLD